METARTNTDGFAYLVKISPDSNNNRYYRMIAQGDAFLIEMGRIGATPVTSRRPMMLWDTTLKRKLAEGYEDRSALCRVDVEKESKYGKISDRDVRTLVDTLQRYANVTLDETYSVSYQDVSQSMIDEAQELIYQISEHQNDLDICRENFKKLFVVIPRKMKDVQEMLPKKADDIPVMLLREQDILDVMTAKISQSSTVTENSSKATVLDSLGLDIRLCTSEENTQIKRFLSKESSLYFKRAFRVVNHKTELQFQKYMENRGLDDRDIHYLYHGSRNANYYGLMSEGPRLNPKAPINGKMFGHGIYFAPRAKKSIGYTDILGSRWVNGNSLQAFLAVYKVVYHNQMDVSVWSAEMPGYTKSKIAPYDAVFAHKGISLVNDEVIIYDENQITVQYLIELEYKEQEHE